MAKLSEKGLGLKTVIRRAIEADISAITEIYNEAVLTTTATFDTEAKSLEDRAAWLKNRSARHGVWVAEFNGSVVGWASLSPWSDRCGYVDTCENSIYVHSAHRGRGVGKALLQTLLNDARQSGMYTVIAKVAGESEASVRLHKAFGFEVAGNLREAGFKFGRRLDVLLMQIFLVARAK